MVIPTVQRHSSRGVLLTPDHKILLVQIENPDGSWIGWITPGGGINPGENETEALKRELYEELGLEAFTPGPKIWRRFNTFPWRGRMVEQRDEFFLVRTHEFVPKPKMNPDAAELVEVKQLRWWSLAELRTSTEIFAPRRLHDLLKDLIENGPPASPLDVGV